MDLTYPMAFVTSPGRVEFQERPLAALGEHGVLLKVRAASICGSDLHILRGKHPRAPLPGALGHEVAGEVAAVGRAVARVREGDRVALEPVIACGRCDACRSGQYNHCPQLTRPHRIGCGGFTPFMVVDEAWVHRLPPGVSFAEGALVEPLAVAVHAIKRTGARFGQSLAIFGAGPLGLLTLQVARAAGMAPSFVADLRAFRLRTAERLQASQVIDAGKADAPAVIEAATGGRGVDVAVEAVGVAATLAGAIRAVRHGGTVSVIGIFEEDQVLIPANFLTGREVSLVGCRGYCWDFQDSLALLARGAVALDTLITHRMPLADLQRGFDLLADPESEAIKVVIEVN